MPGESGRYTAAVAKYYNMAQICNEINDEYGEVIDLFLLFENPTVANCITIVESAGV